MKIKQLIWRNGRAETPFGDYAIFGSSRTWWFEFHSKWSGKSLKTKRDAQAAAQADFDRRARECLEGEQ